MKDMINEAHQAEAEERWGDTDEYRESSRRTASYSDEQWKKIRAELDRPVAVPEGLFEFICRVNSHEGISRTGYRYCRPVTIFLDLSKSGKAEVYSNRADTIAHEDLV